jgi:ABC-type Fe3+ transport system permease subunit
MIVVPIAVSVILLAMGIRLFMAQAPSDESPVDHFFGPPHDHDPIPLVAAVCLILCTWLLYVPFAVHSV